MTIIDPNAYQSWPVETNAADLANDAKAWLRSQPGWDAWSDDPTNFDAGMIDANAQMAAEVRDLAANVPDGIFRRFGAIAGIYPLEALYATIAATVTATNNLGYVLPAGTVFGLRATGDVIYHFTVDDDVTIAPGATVSDPFFLTAQEAGAGPNALGGVSVALVGPLDRTLPWLVSAATITIATGGQDAETTGDYLNRLVIEHRLSAPRPILPDDFADFARRNPAIFRTVAIDRYIPGTNERQTVTHDSTGGTFTLTYSGQTTGNIAWNADATTLQAALVALSNIGPTDVVVTGGPLPTLATVEFTGALAQTNVAAMTANGTNLTGGADVVTITTIRAGAAAQTNQDKAVTVYAIDVNGQDPGEGVRLTEEANLNAKREAGFLASVRAPGYDSIDVVFTAKAVPGWSPADVQSRAIQAVADFLNPALRGAIPFGETPTWFYDDTVRLGELIDALNRVDGLWRVTGPNANGLPSIEGAAADHVLVPAEPAAVVLSTAGTITGTVTA